MIGTTYTRLLFDVVVGVVIQPMHCNGSNLGVLLPLLEELYKGYRSFPAHLQELVGIEEGDPLVLIKSYDTC